MDFKYNFEWIKIEFEKKKPSQNEVPKPLKFNQTQAENIDE